MRSVEVAATGAEGQREGSKGVEARAGVNENLKKVAGAISALSHQFQLNER